MSTKKKKPAAKMAKVIKIRASSIYGKLVDARKPDVSMEAAMKFTGKSMGFLYKAIKAGKLLAFKVGRTTVFRQSDLYKLMEPVPFKPVSARGYSKNFGVKGSSATKRPKTKIHHASELKAKYVKRMAKAKRTPTLKASVAKALSGMATTDVAESSSAGND